MALRVLYLYNQNQHECINYYCDYTLPVNYILTPTADVYTNVFHFFTFNSLTRCQINMLNVLNI